MPVIPPVTTTPDSARRDCGTESTTATGATGTATTIEFLNAAAAPVQLFWLDSSGARKMYGTLPEGAQQSQATFASHPWLVALSSTGQCLAIFIAQSAAGRVVVGDEQALASFYTQTRSVEGMRLKASAKVRPAALDEATKQFSILLRGDRSVVDRMRVRGVQVAIIAESEATTDLPEYRRLRGQKTSDGRSYDTEIRGLGGSRVSPLCSVGEENVLLLPSNRSGPESILIHECAHSLYNAGLDDARRLQWRQIFQAAMAAGRWAGTYAAVNDDEFFAELTQSFFGVNRPADAVHNDVNGTAKLQAYEPDAYALLITVYGDPP